MPRRRRQAAVLAVGMGTVLLVAGALSVAGTVPAVATPSAARDAGRSDGGGAGLATGAEYLVVARDVASLAAARSAVTSAGGRVTGEDAELGVLTASAPSAAAADFMARVDADPAVYGVAHDRKVGAAPKADPLQQQGRGGVRVSQSGVKVGQSTTGPTPKAEPLAAAQWDMAAIGATTTGSYAKQQGSHDVLVGIIDTGVDGDHPDLEPNFNAGLSRTFAHDLPDIDGPCEHPSCIDPVNEDDNGHGTHVAGIVGSPINGIGIAGVAPKVSLVNLRAGQDSGYFFVTPMLQALRYAGDAGIDVVNMSFYVDPWLFNCTANPADSRQAQAEQRAIIEATQRALVYAHRKNVTLISGLGNERIDLDNPSVDATSPDFPAGAAYTRTLDNSTCLTLPAEGKQVIGVSSIGPSGKKASYSNHGWAQTDVAAPGGSYWDLVGANLLGRPQNEVLAPMPHHLVAGSARVDPVSGESVDPFVVSSCSRPGPANCTYWQYLQGTSMASPHAAGVAALIVARYGHRDRSGLTMAPAEVEAVLERTATGVPCPASTVVTVRGGTQDRAAGCVGTAARNSVYGHGVVNAARAVGARG
jgi:lantibiotic leader peptide-processing serine protease